MRFRLVIATAASFSVALPATHGKVTAGCTFLHFSLKAAWLRGLDSLGTHDHLVIHCTWAWRREEPSRSSNLHLDPPPNQGRSELSLYVLTWRGWSQKSSSLHTEKEPDLKEQSCAQGKVTGKHIQVAL